MGDFLRAEIAAGRRYLPAGDRVLRAFQQPLRDVRVLIVGQDPYPTPGNPVGLSFSVAPEVRRLPPSLLNIFREYSEDLGYPKPANGDRTPWAERGVLLLNRVLTVAPGQPGSHRGKGWEEVTEQAIRALAARRAGKRSPSRPSGPSRPGRSRSPRSSGDATPATWRRCSTACRWSSRPTPARTPPTGDSSAPGRSAGPTPCSKPAARTPSTGSCPNQAELHDHGGSRGPREAVAQPCPALRQKAPVERGPHFVGQWGGRVEIIDRTRRTK